MSSTIFNPSMLTASPSPSPSPEPEERPLEGGNASVDDTTLDDAAPKEPEESESDRVEHSWAAMLNTMRVCMDTAPPSKPELLEEQESWLRDWNVPMSDMTVVYERACAASLHVSLNDVDAVTLAEGRIAAKMLMRVVKAWKEKAEESVVTVHPARADKGKVKEVVVVGEKTVEKAAELVLTDMGRLHLGGRMTATSVNRPAEHCERCTASGAKCVVIYVGGRCEACIKARKVCSFVATKNKGRAPAAPKRKAPPSVQTTAPDMAESEVEIVGEATADEPAVGPSKAIVVQQPKRALDSDAAPVVKCPRLEADLELEEARVEAVHLRDENAKLRVQNDQYRLALINMRQHTRIQESKLLYMSNWLYILACDWGNWEKELGEVLED
ncbi:uncharacterized protein F5147DRAFT_772058 [Suillus discolor]|uniref:Uncharacterized protein n=1 Tax=Suillus discolor TaxID=1912936 RepID=A0A9P7JVF5_9AGAM|nr:uncharacterized protein F5147DRAFT_772058 [Suillus discolor]KAG2111339.1 hypothetical protein F5147DRAFT_772058 [Suillus discolor]